MVTGVSVWSTKAIKESQRRDDLMEVRIEKLEEIADTMIEIHEKIGKIEANQSILLKFVEDRNGKDQYIETE